MGFSAAADRPWKPNACPKSMGDPRCATPNEDSVAASPLRSNQHFARGKCHEVDRCGCARSRAAPVDVGCLVAGREAAARTATQREARVDELTDGRTAEETAGAAREADGDRGDA